jgi:hypothetical protein
MTFYKLYFKTGYNVPHFKWPFYKKALKGLMFLSLKWPSKKKALINHNYLILKWPSYKKALKGYDRSF